MIFVFRALIALTAVDAVKLGLILWHVAFSRRSLRQIAIEKEEQEPRARKPIQFFECLGGSCRAENPPFARYCRRCGRLLATEGVAEMIKELKKDGQNIQAEKCYRDT